MKACLYFLSLIFVLPAVASELSVDGLNRPAQKLLYIQNEKSSARDQIATILEAERRVTRVDDAMAIKETGLTYARDLRQLSLV